jgi:peptidoglycan/xylan/chitin deacetylase (PgdA/CDA1 family)
LTYDDGPNCTHNAFYDFLEENQWQATLFYIGSNVLDWPLQAMRGIHDGHEIGVHTWSHRYSTALTNEQFFAELWYSRKAIKQVLGVTPLTWRAPFGDVDDRIRFIAMKMNLTTVLWDQDSL